MAQFYELTYTTSEGKTGRRFKSQKKDLHPIALGLTAQGFEHIDSLTADWPRKPKTFTMRTVHEFSIAPQ